MDGWIKNTILMQGLSPQTTTVNSFTGQKLLDSLAETWDFFFCDVLSMLQAIFHPVQVAYSTPSTLSFHTVSTDCSTDFSTIFTFFIR